MAEEQQVPKKGKKVKLVVFTVVLVAVVGGGAFVVGGRGTAEAAATETAASETATPSPVDGPVALLDPVTLSLADGHYLKVGLALQLAVPDGEDQATEGGHDEGSTEPAMAPEESARALDEAISLFGARTMDQLRSPKQREAAKTELVRALREAYDGEVVDVYFTAFAMQ